MGNAILALAGRVSASIIGQCAAADLPLNCATAFTDGTNTSVASFGNVTFGSFEADPDIAGIGTISSFVASTALFLFIAMSIVLSRIICLGGDIAKKDPSRPAFASLPIPRPRPEDYRAGWIGNRIIDPVINRFSEFWASRPHSRGEYTQAYSDNAHLSRQQPEIDHDTIQIQPYPDPPKFTSSVSEPRYNPLDKSGDAQSASEPANVTLDRDEDTEFVLGSLTSYEKKMLEKSYDIYDILEAALFCISDNQILLSLAFSISFFVKGTAKCILSQYHLKIALNLWLGSAINGVLTFSVVRRYFESPLAGLLRFLALGVSLVLSLGGPLLLELNSGFASEAVPSKDRHNSQIFLNALCFMDPSFRQDVVADQINNHAVIGQSTTNPEASQDFVSWISILVIGGLVVIGRFLHRVIHITRRGHYIKDENNRNKIDLYYWIFLSLVWLFAATSFSYRTWLIFHIRRWVEQSGWLSDQLAEYRLDTFGQFASVMFMVAIAQAMADELVPKERKEK